MPMLQYSSTLQHALQLKTADIPVAASLAAQSEPVTTVMLRLRLRLTLTLKHTGFATAGHFMHITQHSEDYSHF